MKIPQKKFADRHIGTTGQEREEMLEVIGVDSIDALIDQTIPDAIRRRKPLHLPGPMDERAYLKMVRKTGEKNQVFRSFVGQGYYGTITPSPILRNIFENPGWYTQYTPYQAEISQGRLEALLNFQTVVSDLTGLPIANASLLDEATAAAEAMTMLHTIKNKRRKDDTADRFFVDRHVFVQTREVLRSRSAPLGIEIVVGDWEEFDGGDDYFGVLVQFPDSEGHIADFRKWVAALTEKEIYSIVAADLLSLVLLDPPGHWGAHVVVGSTQRFGVPMGYGGPHAAYFATIEDFKRNLPGRIIGVSVDVHGNPALRMALQTREQHIKRERATSNICTAQALLAIMAGMYAVYHGADGLRSIAGDVHAQAVRLAQQLAALGLKIRHGHFFDTICIEADKMMQERVRVEAVSREMNFAYETSAIQISIGETAMESDIDEIIEVFGSVAGGESGEMTETRFGLPDTLERTSGFLDHEVFKKYQTETELMRYIKRLENRDMSLTHSMIPLGSCTMKLNAATQLIPVSWHAFAHMHPFAPIEQASGYLTIIREMEEYLCEITGLNACSLMPNSGAQGELTGLLTIRAYHQANGDDRRDVVLIPSSAHGTNPASAVMAGQRVLVVECDEAGNIDVDDLKKKASEHASVLSGLMVTYPSTHGVFEAAIKDICAIVHENGGLVYMDGANMNAQVGFTSPGEIDVDVCHLNLHKTFAIPHGGGGPGLGPICVNEKLKPFLPVHPFAQVGGEQGIPPVAAAPWSSASILIITHAYINLLGAEGLVAVTENAILSANYLAARLAPHFPILYRGEKGRIAHEFILELRQFKDMDISAEDIAKRLIDYGFHAPTLSFPVAGTFMIEPTESESKEELDRFCDAMIQIKREIEEIANGEADPTNNVLVNAPHTVGSLTDANWKYPYSREKAVFPLPYLYREHKFWSAVGRVDNAYGDRNLVCTCPPIEEYMTQELQDQD